MSARNDHPTDKDLRVRGSLAHHGRLRRGRVRRPVSVATVALASIVVLFAVPDHNDVKAAAARTVAPQAEVTISSRASMLSVPDSFLGLSTEYWALPRFERRVSLFERVLSLVHVRGDGPFVLRVGGDSADHTFWHRTARRTPHWVFGLTPAWLRRAGLLVHGGGVQLILDLNLVTGSPLRAAQWARAAERELPRGSIVGFEIGNEPDIYSRRYWLATVSRTRLGASFLPSDLSSSSYTQDFQAYAQALAQVAPRVPLIGPALAHLALNVNWISSLLASAHPGLGIVSAHRYPLSACADRSSPSYPTIARLLSERASAGIARTVRAAVGLAHRAGFPFRLTELNSVTCGGLPGVSDTFATALWAPDALFELLQAGVDGVNVHVRAHAINAAFTLTRHGLRAHPLLYGLILFARTLGPDARLVQLRLHAKRSSHLKVWAVRVRGGVLHVLLINKSNQATSVGLHLPATSPMTVQRLLAPSASSRSGVRLDGQQLGRDGRWQRQRGDHSITPHTHGYELTIPRESAALLTVHLRAGALALNSGPGHGWRRSAAGQGLCDPTTLLSRFTQTPSGCRSDPRRWPSWRWCSVKRWARTSGRAS